ncbi:MULTISPECIES: phage protein Gp37 [unclassified Psychrobacter]|uniref:phage protein Gp37 n=1 Tax=unclassified Psychrobacter TaxID=196806 RepID=UPI0018F5FFEA|nr:MULTISPECIES: phage protein Gp37 [unclassified Psychrobacter]
MLSQIEQAIKDTLHAYNQAHGGGWVRGIRSYAGDFDAASPDEFAQVVASFPAVWVTFKSSNKPKKVSATKRTRDYVFTVLVAANSSRREETSRQGAFTADGKMLNIGSYQLVELVENALLGSRLGLNIEPLDAGDITMLFNSKTRDQVVSVIAYDWHTSATLTNPDRDDDVPWIETVNIDYVYTDDDRVLASDTAHLNQTISKG